MRVFPFTAIVGQERMKRALVLNAISPQIGGVLIRGERGTAKSTAARALAALLPEIDVVADCPFSCDPHNPEQMCDTCRERFGAEEPLAVNQKQTRFVDLPVSATEDRVVGTLDMERAIKHGERRFEPGVLATANRGLLYVDEVNLLDDHVVDLLLDSAAMGVNVVEREGISFSHPARFILVGTMNPEEGELRPQLLDRFALCVDIQGILDPASRVEIVNRRLRYEQDPEAFYQEWSEMEALLSERIAQARVLLPDVTYQTDDLYFIAELTSEMEVDGHRADIVILKAALAHAAFDGRETIDDTDILLAAELALPHRLRRQPFEDTDSKMAVLEQRLEEARGNGEEPSDRQRVEDSVLQGKKKTESLSADAEADSQAPAQNVPMRGHHADTKPLDHLRKGGQSVEVGNAFKPRGFKTPLDKESRRLGGRRSYTVTSRKRGRYIYSRPAREQYDDIALDATVRQAAIHQSKREHEDTAITIRGEDLQRKVRVRKASNLIVFAVDASWSMAAAERMKATKGAIMSLLVDAYQKRDRVCMVSFQKDCATLVLPPTSSVEMAKKALRDIPVGGKTPLSAGLSMAYQVIERERNQNSDLRALMFLLTDGAGNVSMMGMPPREEALLVADLFAQKDVHSVVINTEHQSLDRGLAQELADVLNAPCESLTDIRAENLYKTVRRALQK